MKMKKTGNLDVQKAIEKIQESVTGSKVSIKELNEILLNSHKSIYEIRDKSYLSKTHNPLILYEFQDENMISFYFLAEDYLPNIEKTTLSQTLNKIQKYHKSMDRLSKNVAKLEEHIKEWQEYFKNNPYSE
jgi:hypothetical protein